ncbi:TetR/AcrR family transcriptional regulator [Prosthecomicrobium hirschii]|uniref:TetR/AcrR family transcriptional regulator n=1 Tax=Prosthecodimorpha hirschii TaxID=665126 RepID=UPI001126D011|nr:TetR/AcrR family transcriptional regulator [Prosthecomicrobium hirschii]TPQ47745.1 TetR/AcrR family transcriptional regulator [Prosthecomicrobium hirschii]
MARERRRQKDRTAETSARLKAATIDLLHDRGFWRMSTVEIARQAGVSRGALTHHFASREEIITESVADMLRRVTDDLHRFAEDFADRGGSSDEIVDYIWRMMSDRLFYVTMEFLPEARHNADFKARLIPVVRAFHAGLDAIWTALAARSGVDPDRTRTAMNASMCLVRGMIAQTVIRDDPLYYTGLLDFWKTQLRPLFPVASGRGAEGGRAPG